MPLANPFFSHIQSAPVASDDHQDPFAPSSQLSLPPCSRSCTPWRAYAASLAQLASSPARFQPSACSISGEVPLARTRPSSPVTAPSPLPAPLPRHRALPGAHTPRCLPGVSPALTWPLLISVSAPAHVRAHPPRSLASPVPYRSLSHGHP
ncbi:hypothetical protein FRC08_002902 [Ceratobasidium sp. 394]|nr:hypothetical protein FRC08_002902 [Ceratobasidium sp. 394]